MRYHVYLLLNFCLVLVACSSSNYAPVRQGSKPINENQDSIAAKRQYVPKEDFYPISNQLQCVPHARDISGIQIRGDAHTWWDQAVDAGYKRSQKPKKGAVFVLAKTSRLRSGHLSVVKRIIDNRTIEVEHVNWGGSMEDRCIVYRYMPVQDISKNNDWTLVRFWNYPSKTYGSLYKGSGFIYPKKTSRNFIMTKSE